MNFSCDRCGRAYAVADEKVRGRSFRVPCRACGHVIVVRAPAAAPAIAVAPRAPIAAPPATRPAAPPRVAAAAPAPSAAPSPVAGAAAVPAPVAIAPAVPASPPRAIRLDRGPPARAAAGMSGAELAWLAGDAAPFGEDAPEPPAESTMEIARLAVPARPRRRRLALAAAAAAAGLAGLAALARLAPRAAAGAPPARAPGAILAAAGPGATFDPAALALHAAAPAAAVPEAAAPAPAPAPAPDRAPARRRSALRIAARDRKLLDLLGRKADAAPAAPAAADEAAVDTSRAALSDDALAKTLAGNRGAFSACVDRALRYEPNLRLGRRAEILVTVQPSGVVSAASFEDPDLARSGLGRCLAAASRRMVFPAFDGDAFELAIPLALTAVR